MGLYSSRVALLANLIDYAGTFAPAALPLDKAMQEACAFRRQARHPWLLGKIAITIADLKKLSVEAWFNAGSDGTPLPITVIGSAVERSTEWASTVRFESRELRRFNERFSESAQRQYAVSYETRLGEDCADDEIARRIGGVLDAALEHGALGFDPFIEIPLSGDWQNRLARATRALADWADEHPGALGRPGIKIRTGGNTAPSSEQLAEALTACTSHKLRFKATQGLHHAVTRGTEFGFVNLFGALAFAQTFGVDQFGPKEVAACLKDSQAASFRFGGERFEWTKYALQTEQIEAARRQYGGTFGSCSVAEPDEFLAQELKGDET